MSQAECKGSYFLNQFHNSLIERSMALTCISLTPQHGNPMTS
jgi:hypothetical protein